MVFTRLSIGGDGVSDYDYKTAWELAKEQILNLGQLLQDKDDWACLWKRVAKEYRAFYQLAMGTAKSNQLKWHEAERTATRLRGWLRELEWILLQGHKGEDGKVAIYLGCPVCKNMKMLGHADDCELAKELKDDHI